MSLEKHHHQYFDYVRVYALNDATKVTVANSKLPNEGCEQQVQQHL